MTADWDEDRCKLIARHGYWQQHPEYPLATWRTEVTQGCTLLGYWDWVLTELEREDLGVTG